MTAGAIGAESGDAMTPLRRIRAILGGSIGSLVEWYDWFAYSAFTLYFTDHFFPPGDQTAQLLQAAAIFAVGFLARPMGAWAMGYYADRIGRRAALSLAVGLMSLGSFAIAAIPGYQAIGVLAPMALTLARVLQGLSVGGQYGTAATYMSEVAGQRHRGFWSSFQYVTVALGQLLALLVLIVLQRVLSTADLQDWGWRIPFVLGGVLALAGFWSQVGLEESGAFARMEAGARKGLEPSHMRWVLILLAAALAICAGLFISGNPSAMSLSVAILVAWQLSLAAPLARDHPREVLIVVGLTAGGSMSFYAYTTYIPKFLVNTAHFSKDAATAISAAALVVYMALLPLMGRLSDLLGRRFALLFTFGLGTAFTYPIMSALAHASSPLPALGLAAALCAIHSGYSSVSAVVKAELFPTAVRAMGVALPYAITNTIFGGTAEYLALWFKSQKIESGFYIYVSAAMALALAVALRLRNTNATSDMAD